MGKLKKKPLDKFDCNFIKSMNEQDDTLYKNRDKERYKLIAYLSKYMLCNFHWVEIIRRYYLDTLTGKHVFLLDENLKMEKHEHIARKDKEFIKRKVYKQKATYPQVASVYDNCISPCTVYRLIKRESISYSINFNSHPKKYKYIYIDIDDTFINLKTHNKGMEHKCKIVHTYQDYVRNGKRFINEIKMVLVNRSHMNSKECLNWTINQIRTVLIENYGDLSNFIIIVSGDGAKYIKTIAKAFNAQTGLDRWHLFNKIRAAFKTQALKKFAFINCDALKKKSKKNKYAERIIQLIKDANINEAYKLLLKVRKVCGFYCWELNSLIAYFQHNLKSIDIWSNPTYYGTFTETFVQQLVKCHFGDVGKCYSVNIFMRILNANCLATLYR